MIIGVDLDDVLSKTVVALDKFHNKKYGTNFKIADHHTFDLTKVWSITPDEYRQIIHDFNSSDDFDQIEPIFEAQEGIANLSKKHQVKIITSRMEKFGDKTKKWLTKHFPNIDLDLHHANHYYGMNEHKKSHLCKMLGVKVLIDDCLEYALECSEENIPVILLDRPWNQTKTLPKNITRLKNWDEVLKKIDTMES